MHIYGLKKSKPKIVSAIDKTKTNNDPKHSATMQ